MDFRIFGERRSDIQDRIKSLTFLMIESYETETYTEEDIGNANKK